MLPRKLEKPFAVRWTDESESVHRLTEFAGYPVILLPIYTRCRTACVNNVGQLKEALSEASADPTQFRVLLFSFDPTDTPAVLSAYRLREKIPLAWSLGTGSRQDTEMLLESIGFQYGQAGKEYTTLTSWYSWTPISGSRNGFTATSIQVEISTRRLESLPVRATGSAAFRCAIRPPAFRAVDLLRRLLLLRTATDRPPTGQPDDRRRPTVEAAPWFDPKSDGPGPIRCRQAVVCNHA